jgi:hypothetical protein
VTGSVPTFSPPAPPGERAKPAARAPPTRNGTPSNPTGRCRGRAGKAERLQERRNEIEGRARDRHARKPAEGRGKTARNPG